MAFLEKWKIAIKEGSEGRAKAQREDVQKDAETPKVILHSSMLVKEKFHFQRLQCQSTVARCLQAPSVGF